jgi:competence CoiA-like predicted nuclease
MEADELEPAHREQSLFKWHQGSRGSRVMSLSAKQLTIDEVMDSQGRLVSARALLDAGGYAALLQLRNHVQECVAASTPMYRCPACAQAVVVRCQRRSKADPRDSRSFHFRHARRSANCPLSEDRVGVDHELIRAAKYQGQREGELHRRLKQLIHDSLVQDSGFSSVAMERTWRLEGDPRQWRRPDVSACFLGQQVAFEIQLSTTFVDVMAARRVFYREAGALLVWVVARFDASWAALAEEDIFYPNNRNIFVVDDETLMRSEQRRRLCLRVHWHQPTESGSEEPQMVARERIAEFSELTLDHRGQRVFLVDVAGEESALRRGLLDPLRIRFEKFYFASKASLTLEQWRARDREWASLRAAFESRGVSLPQQVSQIESLLNSIYSAREARLGRLVGWRYRNLTELAHHLFVQHPEVLWPFRQALKCFRCGPLMKGQDPKGKLESKKRVFQESILSGESRFRCADYATGLLSVLFPSLAKHLAVSPASVIREEPRAFR